MRSGSESSGEVENGRKGEVEGPINMTEPWIEGPKSAKVSVLSISSFIFADFLSTKNCRLGTAKLGRPASCTGTTRRFGPPRNQSLGDPRGSLRLSAGPAATEVTPACGW